jgi:hypothetical protein
MAARRVVVAVAECIAGARNGECVGGGDIELASVSEIRSSAALSSALLYFAEKGSAGEFIIF